MPRYYIVGERGGKGRVITAKNLDDARKKGLKIYKKLFMVKREPTKTREYESRFLH